MTPLVKAFKTAVADEAQALKFRKRSLADASETLKQYASGLLTEMGALLDLQLHPQQVLNLNMGQNLPDAAASKINVSDLEPDWFRYELQAEMEASRRQADEDEANKIVCDQCGTTLTADTAYHFSGTLNGAVNLHIHLCPEHAGHGLRAAVAVISTPTKSTTEEW